jgi:hypothetical protein
VIDPKALHPEATFLRVLGVEYVHVNTTEGGDLYITAHGVPFIRQLAPECWYEESWFKAHRIRLEGSGAVYRVPTKPVDALSIDLVVKWSRVGQDVPLDTLGVERNLSAEFNTPFEEFALVEELRRGGYGPRGRRVLTQKPLAIYVPPEEMQLWQSGRSKQRIVMKARQHPGVAIDVLRSYVMIYGWVEGLDAVQAYERLPVAPVERGRRLRELTQHVERELAAKGFTVADHKPSHFIVRLNSSHVKRRRDGRPLYALIDYELLARTPEYDAHVRDRTRCDFAARLRDRFRPRDAAAVEMASLRPCNVLGVDYLVGTCQSTGGRIWIVGNDPGLLPYLLPERWRAKQVKLSQRGETYYAQTKDRAQVVWKVSRVGELPPGDLSDPDYRRMLMQGINSPFEEVSYALELSRRGVDAVAPLAIYTTPDLPDVGGIVLDERRFEQMKDVNDPYGRPVLPLDHDFITVWSYWRGASDGAQVWTPINAMDARAKGLISAATCDDVLVRHRAALARAGIEPLQLSPQHVLLAYVPEADVQRDREGLPLTCHCNFEMVRHVRPAAAGAEPAK